MASKRQQKVVVSKSAGTSPTQTSKLQMLMPSSEVPQQTSVLTLELLQKGLSKQTELITQIIEEKIQKVSDEMHEIIDVIQKQHDAMREDIVLAFQGMWGQIQEIVQSNIQMENKIQDVQDKMEKTEGDCLMIQYRAMEWALRVRGLRENDGENLRQIFAEALGKFAGDSNIDWDWQIDKIYRVNSWIARQKKLPRDIVIYFVTRNMRNKILQHSYRNKLQVAGQEVVIMKEIPPKMLRARKDYAFLVTELRSRQLQYRWEAPIGLVVNFKGERYRLNTVFKARDFYKNILKVDKPSSPENRRKEIQEIQAQAQGGVLVTQQDLLQFSKEGSIMEIPQKYAEPQQQRQTRAATKRKDQDSLKKQVLEVNPKIITTTTEAVGGARLKMSLEDFDAVLQRLSGVKDND